MNKPQINMIQETLEELQAQSILVINMQDKSIICDHMILATANSHRQMEFIAQALLRDFKKDRAHTQAETDEHWTLVDLGQTIVHIMTPEARININLEELWGKK